MSKQRLRQALVAALLLLAAWLVALLAVIALDVTALDAPALADAAGAWPADEAAGADAPAYAPAYADTDADTDSNADDFGAATTNVATASSATPAAPRAQRAGEFRFPARARSPCSRSAQTSAGARGSEAEHAA